MDNSKYRNQHSVVNCSMRGSGCCTLLQGELEYRNHQSAVLGHTYSHMQRGAEGKLRCSGCLWENSNVEHVAFQGGLWTSRAGHLGRKYHMNEYLTENTTAFLDQFHTFPLLSSWSGKAKTYIASRYQPKAYTNGS